MWSRRTNFLGRQIFYHRWQSAFRSDMRKRARRPVAEFPLTLNTGRIRDQWHTMTRSGRSQRLSQHFAEPYVELHPEDAVRYALTDADLVRVSTGLGAILVRVLISARQKPGSIFVPMHWSGPIFRQGTCRCARAVFDRPRVRATSVKECRGADRAFPCSHVWIRGFAAEASQYRRRILGDCKMHRRMAD